MATPQPDTSSALSHRDNRAFFEKALQWGLREGVITPAKLDEIRRDAPKGVVQIARYFGSEFLHQELVKAQARLINLVSLNLEESSQGDLRLAAEALRDHSLLSRSKGASDMLRRLITLPTDGLMSTPAQGVFTDDLIPQLDTWSLRSLEQYRQELGHRRHWVLLRQAVAELATRLDNTSLSELQEADTEAEAFIRTALLALATPRSDLPDWPGFKQMIEGWRAKVRQAASALDVPLPVALSPALTAVVEPLWQSVLSDLHKVARSTQSVEQVFLRTMAFNDRYCWAKQNWNERVEHDPTASKAWTQTFGAHSDEGSLLTAFLCVAAQSRPKTLLSKSGAETLIRQLHLKGLDADLARRYILDHAPEAHQASYLTLWSEFLVQSQATLLSDAYGSRRDALALLRRECNVKPD